MNTIRKEIMGLLSDFASEKFQKKAWIEGDKKIIFFPSEFLCMWFDDIVFDPNYLIKNNILTQEEWRIIEPFHELLDDFSKKAHKKIFDEKPELLLDYEPWKKIREKAKKTLQELGWENKNE